MATSRFTQGFSAHSVAGLSQIFRLMEDLLTAKRLSTYARGILRVGLRKPLCEQSLLSRHAYFGAEDEKDCPGDPHRPPSVGRPHRHQHEEHGCVDRVPHDAVRAGSGDPIQSVAVSI